MKFGTKVIHAGIKPDPADRSYNDSNLSDINLCSGCSWRAQRV